MVFKNSRRVEFGFDKVRLGLIGAAEGLVVVAVLYCFLREPERGTADRLDVAVVALRR